MKKLFFILFLYSHWLFSQDLIHYSTEDGLPHDITYNIYSDDKGYMWFGSDDGLVKFNGKKFTIFNEANGLKNTYAIDVKPYAKDTLAIATWGGGLHLLAKDTIFKIINSTSTKINELVTGSRRVFSYIAGQTVYYEKRNGKWKSIAIGVNSQIEYIERESQAIRDRKIYSPRVTIIRGKEFLHNRFIKEANMRELKGVFILKKKKLIPVFSFLKNKVITTLKDYGDRYICSTKDSLFVFNRQEILQKEKLEIDGQVILKIIPFLDTKILILSANKNGFKEAHQYDLKTKELVKFREKYSIKSNISDIGLDFEQNIWMTTNGEGIYQIPNYSYNIKSILENKDIHKLIVFDDKVYALNPSRLYEFYEKRNTKSYELKGFGKFLSVHNKKLEVSSYLEGKEREITSKINEVKGTYSFFNKDIKIVGLDTILINGKYNLKLPSSVKNACDFEGKVYFATDFGMFIYDKETEKIVKSNYSQINNKSVTDIIKQDDFLWVSTSRGLYKLDEEGTSLYDVSKGLISNNIKDLLVTSDNKLWIATVKGVSVFDGTSFFNLTKNENLPSNNINHLLEDKKGNVWIASVKGISVLDNQKQSIPQKLPKINVYQNKSAFKFDVISYNSSHTIFAQYQINNEPWVTTNSNELNFKNFKEGKYTFKIRAKKPNSDWQLTPIYSFAIEIPFYQKKSFIIFTIMIVFITIILFTLHRLRVSKQLNNRLHQAIDKQKKLEERISTVRDHIAEDFHDDLGNKLASITILTDILSQKVTTKESRSIVNQILTNTDSLYKGTKDFVWSLKKESDQVEEMVTYLSDFGEDFFQNLNIKFRIEKSLETDVKLPHYWSRQLILIFKEAMTNAAKHSNCSEVTIVFSFLKGKLEISVTDNGIGFSTEKLTHKNGLKNIVNRAKKIGGDIKINSSEVGTEVKFSGIIYPKQVVG
ncbi:two-component regulator propeller domain-containing protein [Pseudotenacibaculum sp. MALMAid0570]|uniref:sensor histidine kinase n=1 Tax=Pseudotenacibaculum sp. MALMAid0570 TaxID=3143938 RepID=UPI0032E0124F